jgi:outer membrane protein assembly factor BamB
MIFGAGTMVGNYVAFGVSSLDNYLGPLFDPHYPGFTFRGNVVLIDPAIGRIVWQTFTVGVPSVQPDGSYGPSGATVWGSPAYDRASNTIFVGTGQNYGAPWYGAPPAPPPDPGTLTRTSDALIALDAATGAIKWVNHETPDETWNITFGPPNNSDLDFGDSPQLYRLNGRLVVAAGQKSGFFHVVDAQTGAAVTPPHQFLAPGGLGGFHTDSAEAGGINYAPGNHWANIFAPPTPADHGAVFAVSGDGSTQVWKFDTASPIIGGVAVANGVVYVQDVGGVLYAVDAATGRELARVATGSALSGPAISRGQIYLGDGNISVDLDPFGEQPPGAISALGIDGPAAAHAQAGSSPPGGPVGLRAPRGPINSAAGSLLLVTHANPVRPPASGTLFAVGPTAPPFVAPDGRSPAGGPGGRPVRPPEEGRAGPADWINRFGSGSLERSDPEPLSRPAGAAAAPAQKWVSLALERAAADGWGPIPPYGLWADG